MFLSSNRSFSNETTKFLFKQIIFRTCMCYFNETSFSQIIGIVNPKKPFSLYFFKNNDEFTKNTF